MKSTITLHPREILAWIVLVCAILLFSVSISFAQNKKSKSDSSIKIKIEKDENGKKTKIDTTITSDQLPAMKEYLKGMDIDLDGSHSDRGEKDITMHIRHPKMGKEDQDAFDNDMKKLKEEMKNLDHEMKDMHIEMYSSGDNDFDLNMQMPRTPMPPMPPTSNGFFFDGDDDGNETECKHGKHFNFQFHSMNDDVPDSLNDDQHIILYGAKGEDTPVIEKEITTKDGNKVFVFKRKLPKEENAKTNTSMQITKLKVYPNPGNGKFSLSFASVSEGDVQISITDAKGKEVFTKTLKNFSGEYFNQLDISDKGKGTYFIKISQGDDSITKKLVVE